VPGIEGRSRAAIAEGGPPVRRNYFQRCRRSCAMRDRDLIARNGGSLRGGCTPSRANADVIFGERGYCSLFADGTR
jgi:hypothetical protein